MISRRSFCESGVACSVAYGVAPWSSPRGRDAGAARAANETARAHFHAVLFDERFAEAVRFGGAARCRGLPARAVRGDMTQLWYHELEPMWRREPRPLAGLTAYAALFCLERLARDHQLRVVHHGTHTARARGAIEHVIRGPWRPDACCAGGICELGCGGPWPQALAAGLALQQQHAWVGLPPAVGVAPERLRSPGTPRGRLFEEPLHSWVIAPAARQLERT